MAPPPAVPPAALVPLMSHRRGASDENSDDDGQRRWRNGFQSIGMGGPEVLKALGSIRGKEKKKKGSQD